ncbi:MAG: Na/Pi cotransporter family protein [bacterium]|nr:Na/Pi cotransporter family protein [bacterium]
MTTQQIIEMIFKFLAGLGVFLFGVKTLSDNMEKLANRKLKALFRKTAGSKIIGVGIGAAATALVQSSGITTVMVVGFVNAGIMTLTQAAAVIMGANIGTTITVQIVALQGFGIETYAIALSLVGIVMDMVCKNKKLKALGFALTGLGLIFVGLGFMKESMKSIAELQIVRDILSSVDNPFLLLFVGIVLTAVVQSSTAINTIIVSMVAAGLTIGSGGNSVLYLIMGSNIGTCVTSLLSSIGASKDAKAASLIHLLFNVFGTLIFFIMLLCWQTFMEDTLERWFISETTQIAMFHTIFNTVSTLLFLPFTTYLVKLAEFIIGKGKNTVEQSYIDKRFLNAPTVAIEQSAKECMRIGDLAMASLKEGLDIFLERNVEKTEKISEKTAEVYELNKKLTDYLITISSSDLTLNDEKRVSIIHNNNSDVARIAELADNFIKYTNRVVNDEIVFSNGVEDSLKEMFGVLEELYKTAKQARLSKDKTLLKTVDEKEDQLDNLRRALVAAHIKRLGKGECKADSSGVYINLVSNLERAGDHLSFIAHSIEEVEYA